MVLIFSNSSHDKSYTLKHQGDIPPKLFVNNIGCWGWKGKASFEVIGETTKLNTSGELTWKRTEWPKRDEVTPLTIRPHTLYEASGTMSGTWVDSECSFTGKIDYGLTPNMPLFQNNYLKIYTHSVGGSWDRVAFGSAFDAVLPPAIPPYASYSCKEENRGYPLHPPAVHIPRPEENEGRITKVATDGSLKGSFRGVDDKGQGTIFTWDLKPIREP